jgi:hypothetical protein
MPRKLSKKLSKKCVKKQVRITKKGGAKLNKLNKSVKRGRPAKKSKKTMKGGVLWGRNRKKKEAAAEAAKAAEERRKERKKQTISGPIPPPNPVFLPEMHHMVNVKPAANTAAETAVLEQLKNITPFSEEVQLAAKIGEEIAAKAASTPTPQNASCSRQKAKECAPCIARVKVKNNSEEERRKFEMLSEFGMVFVSLHDYYHDGYLTVKEGDLLFIESEYDGDFYNNSNNDDTFEFTNTRTEESGFLPKSFVKRYQATHTALREVESDEASRINSGVTTSIEMSKGDKLILFDDKRTEVVKVYNMTRRAVGTVPKVAIEPVPEEAIDPATSTT